MASVRPARESPSSALEPEDLERKDRIRAQLVAGERIATRDIQPGEYFVQLHRAILRALNTAHRLTAAQRQYLGVLMEYSYGYRSPWAIRDMADRRPPSLADWCNWLGGWSSEQVCGVRKQLLDLRVIHYVGENSSYVSLNETWEEWDQELFTRHEKRAGAGRPGKVISRINALEREAPLICKLTDANLQINSVNSQIKLDEFPNSRSLIHKLTDDGPQAASQEGGTPPLNKRRTEEVINTGRRGTHPHSQEPIAQGKEENTPDNYPTSDDLLSPMASFERTTNNFASQFAKGYQDDPQAQQFLETSQAVLFSAIAMPALSQPEHEEQRELLPSRRGLRSTSERKIPPQNTLYAVWKEIKPPATERQRESIIIGLAELANEQKTLGHPVRPEELPLLMYQIMSWEDRKTGKNYSPTPWMITKQLGDLRDEVRDYPCPRVLAWLSWRRQHQMEVTSQDASAAINDLPHLIATVQAFEAYLREGICADPADELQGEDTQQVALPTEAPAGEQPDEMMPEDEALEDFGWTVRLRRHVPDAEGARHGTPERDVGMLWGFVRDVLRPGLNTARRQHLDSVTPAWDSEHPSELLLLSSSDYTARFINMTLRREIDEQIGKLLSRFFDRATPIVVPQWVIEQLNGRAEKE